MLGYDEFNDIIGKITLSQVAQFIMLMVFLWLVYKKVKHYFEERYETMKRREEADKQRDTQIKEALEAVRQYPEYRQQSIAIQEKLENEIRAIRISQQEYSGRLEKMEEDQKRRERNKLRDHLLQSYRYYTNPDTNPKHSWSRMEAEAFWELFRDYEEAGGNGYVHTVVQPAMNLLTVHECPVSE